MATIKNKRKIAAVSIETPESTRNSRGQNRLDPESTQDYISQVSEEIEGRVTKKFSKEFSRTDSRILGALSRLDEFLLNPQVRTCSVAVPGIARIKNSENLETSGDRSSDDHGLEVRYYSHHSGHLNNPEAENYPHNKNDLTSKRTRSIYFEKINSFCIFFGQIKPFQNVCFFGNSFFLLRLSMFAGRIHSSGTNFITFHLQWLIMLDFW